MLFHELKTPLTATSLRAQLLERELSNALAHVAALKECLNVQMQILDRLSKIGELESASLVRISDLASEIKTLFEPVAESKGRKLAFFVSDGQVQLKRTSMLQVLTNLIGNALSHAKSCVEVSLSSDEFSVKDDGDGIAEEMLPHLFDPFVRGASSTGNGLGLAIAKALVLEQGGTISAKNASGAVFLVRLREYRLDSCCAPLRD